MLGRSATVGGASKEKCPLRTTCPPRATAACTAGTSTIGSPVPTTVMGCAARVTPRARMATATAMNLRFIDLLSYRFSKTGRFSSTRRPSGCCSVNLEDHLLLGGTDNLRKYRVHPPLEHILRISTGTAVFSPRSGEHTSE